MENIEIEALSGKISELSKRLDENEKQLKELKTKLCQPNNESGRNQVTREEIQTLFNTLNENMLRYFRQWVDFHKITVIELTNTVNVIKTKIEEIKRPDAVPIDTLKRSLDNLTTMITKQKTCKIGRFTFPKTTIIIICLSVALLTSFSFNIKQLVDFSHLNRQYGAAIKYINEITPLE